MLPDKALATELSATETEEADKPAAEKTSNLQDSAAASALPTSPPAPCEPFAELLSASSPLAAKLADAGKPAAAKTANLQTSSAASALEPQTKQPSPSPELTPAPEHQPSAPEQVTSSQAGDTAAADAGGHESAGLSQLVLEQASQPASAKTDNLQSLPASSATPTTPVPAVEADSGVAGSKDAAEADKPAAEKTENRQSTSAGGTATQSSVAGSTPREGAATDAMPHVLGSSEAARPALEDLLSPADSSIAPAPSSLGRLDDDAVKSGQPGTSSQADTGTTRQQGACSPELTILQLFGATCCCSA